eukprot:6434548-Alexandrium_andersonii.AAC.1
MKYSAWHVKPAQRGAYCSGQGGPASTRAGRLRQVQQPKADASFAQQVDGQFSSSEHLRTTQLR